MQGCLGPDILENMVSTLLYSDVFRCLSARVLVPAQLSPAVGPTWQLFATQGARGGPVLMPDLAPHHSLLLAPHRRGARLRPVPTRH